jgi:hypothetical protein
VARPGNIFVAAPRFSERTVVRIQELRRQIHQALKGKK